MPELTLDNWSYRPHSGDPAGALPAGWAEALAALDFRPVGILERRLPPLSAPGGPPPVNVPRRHAPQPEQIAVWGAPDGRAFALVEPYFDEALFSLRTLAASGVVVETTVASRRPPARLPGNLTASVFSGRWLTRRFTRGDEEGRPEAVDEGWIRSDRPAAGYHLELVPVEPDTPPARVAALLWEEHQARLVALLPEAEFPRHDNLTLFLALLLRTHRVATTIAARLARLERATTYLLNMLGILLAAVLPLVLLLQGGLGSQYLQPFIWAGSALLLLMAVVYLLQAPLRRYLAGRTLRPVPAGELVKRVRSDE